MDCSHASTHQGPRSLVSPSALSTSTLPSSSCLHFLHDSKAAAFAPAQQHSLHTIMRPMQATQAAQATQPIHVAELIDRLKLLGHLELTVDTDRGTGDAAGSSQHQAVTITNTTTNDSRTFLLPLQHGQQQQQQAERHGGWPLRCDLGEIGRVCDDVDAIVNGLGAGKPIGEADAGVCGATAITTDDDCSTSSTTAASSISTITACDSLVVESVSAEDGIDGNDDGSTAATMTHYSDEDQCELQVQMNVESAQSSISGSTSAAAVIEKRVRFCTCDVIPSCNDGESDSSSKDSNKRTPSNDHKCCAIREPACIPTLSRKEYTWAEREATWHSLKDLLLFKSQADSDWNDVRKGRKPMERGLEHRVKLIVKDDDDDDDDNDDNDGDNDGNSDEANSNTSGEDDLASCRRNKLILRHRKKQRAAARNAVLDAQDGFERMRPLVSKFPEEEDDMHDDVTAATDCNEERVAAAYCEHTYSSQTLAAIIGLLDQKVANEIYQEDAHVSEMVGDDASISLNTSSSSTVKNKNERYVHSPRRRRAMLKMTLKCQKHRYILPGM